MPDVTRGFVSLLDDMGKCRICHDLELGPNPIFQLSAKARLLILGQAPGRIAHAKNRPFDDPSGDRLRRWLGVDQETFYTDPKIGIFPMGLCFPGGGKGGDQPPRAVCAEIWRQPVLDHLKQRQFTVLMGRYATDWHMPHLRCHSAAEAARASLKRQERRLSGHTQARATCAGFETILGLRKTSSLPCKSVSQRCCRLECGRFAA